LKSIPCYFTPIRVGFKIGDSTEVVIPEQAGIHGSSFSLAEGSKLTAHCFLLIAHLIKRELEGDFTTFELQYSAVYRKRKL
jgi:hypothetical protein